MFERSLLARAFPNNPRMLAEMEALGDLIDAARANVADLESKAADALSRVTSLEDKDSQPRNGWLDAISGLPVETGALEITDTDEVHARPIDTDDDASLLSKARGDTLYAAIGSGGGGGGITTNALSFAATGGAAPGATFNGSAAIIVDYHTIGAQVAGSYQPAGSYQTASSLLTAYAGAAWGAGVQVPTLTAANTIALKTVGSAAGNLLDKAAGDALYQPLGSYLTGNQTITLSGDVSGSGTTAITVTIGANKVTRGMLAQTAGAALLGAAAAGNISDLTGTQATALLDVFTTTLKGLVPASGGGTTNFLRADGSWATPTSGGAWTVISSTSYSAGGKIDISGLSFSSYNMVRILLLGITVSGDGRNITIQLRNSSGIITSNYKYNVQNNSSSNTNQTSNSISDSKLYLNSNTTNFGVGNATTDSLSAEIMLFKPGSAALFKQVTWTGSHAYNSASTNVGTLLGGGSLDDVSAITGIVVATANGTTASTELTGGLVVIMGQ